MTAMQFVTAAERVEIETGERPEPDTLEFTIAGEKFRLTLPSATQVVFLSTTSDEGSLTAYLRACMDFLRGLMTLDDSFVRLKRLVSNGTVSIGMLLGGDENNPKGIVDWVIEQVSEGNPPKSSTGSSESPPAGGKKSTGRAPGKGSIPSTSR